ncbi:MAG TPA: putative glycoside hydrolase [Fimbriimonadaceae bacterium]|nr:putative glycoside hydrolase [Fimbriimonadaceae bacterium]
MNKCRRFHQLWVGLGLALIVTGCGEGAGNLAAKAEPNPNPVSHTPPEPEPPKEKHEAFKKPEHVRGIYLTAWSAGSKRKMEKVYQMLKETELNAVVIDIRDSGNMYWKTGIKLADESGATQNAVAKPDELYEALLKNEVYPIARISCFRDVWVPKKHVARAVQFADGRPWKDRSGHTWLDPYQKVNWEYIAEVVDFALDQGFPEIQLDYVRFPSEGKVSTMVFPGKKDYPDPNAKPEDVIAAFADFIRERVHKRGAVISADIFGIISSGTADQGIGQELEKISAPFDLICPMVYPSHFARGEYGIANPNASPYEIVLKSLRDYSRRLPGKPVRPWLQDFSLGVKYGVKEVQAQIKAAKELGYNEYLLWNARNQYTAAAVKDTSKLVKPKPAEPAADEPSTTDKPAGG